MKLSALFTLRTAPTEGILALLTETTLGTNGAKYRHLDTRTRIYEADNPLFLSMERNNSVAGTITFCRRNEHWYIRYFAFRSYAQGGQQRKSEDKSDSVLKQTLHSFFGQVLDGSDTEYMAKSMYAYIDPNNERSKWMSENFGFQTIAKLVTQSYSRVWPSASGRLVKIADWDTISDQVRKTYGDYKYYTETHCTDGPFYGIQDEHGQLLAFARAVEVNWEIVRMPGKWGAQLTTILPYIPFLRRIIKPKHHRFLVPEIVWCENNRSELLNELFEAILSVHKCNLILWWTDVTDPLYQTVQSKMRWGILHKITGANPVDVVERCTAGYQNNRPTPVFVTAFDLV